MRILNEKDMEILEAECDLTCGYFRQETIIRADAAPIDNATKFAWADEDYETIRRYIVIPEEERYANRIAELKAKLTATDYAVIKIAEGAAAKEDYASLILDREAWRKEINELEAKTTMLK